MAEFEWREERLRARREQPPAERLVGSAARALVALSMLLGGVAGVALLGFNLVGPSLPRASRPVSATSWLVIALAAWPALAALYLALQALREYRQDERREARRFASATEAKVDHGHDVHGVRDEGPEAGAPR